VDAEIFRNLESDVPAPTSTISWTSRLAKDTKQPVGDFVSTVRIEIGAIRTGNIDAWAYLSHRARRLVPCFPRHRNI
jgi:hypothetical protein